MPLAARVLVDCASVPTCRITGPGCPTVVVGSVPIACMGDTVTGAIGPAAYVGTIVGGVPTVMAGGRPVAFVGAPTTGVLTPPPPAPPVPGTPQVVMTQPPPCTVMVG
jgi:uncharacterized Zn-binding protein involved in type VI secretion